VKIHTVAITNLYIQLPIILFNTIFIFCCRLLAYVSSLQTRAAKCAVTFRRFFTE